MADHRHYVPILKGKKGEYNALASLDAKLKTRYRPMIEIVGVPWDHQKDEPAKTIDAHLEGTVTDWLEAWGTEHSFFVDCDEIPASEHLANGMSPMQYIGETAMESGLKMIPVTGLEREAEYQKSVRDIAQRMKHGACLRLDTTSITVQGQQLEASVNSLLESLKLSPAEIDLVLDFESLGPAQAVGTVVLMITSVINMIPRLGEWRSFTVAATAYPTNMSVFAPDEVGSAPRTEWLAWKHLIANTHLVKRLPAFGDYGINSAAFPDFNPITMSTAAKIRYTTEDCWLIAKGRSLRKLGGDQFFNLASTIARRKEFCGKEFSPGDAYLHERANRSKKTTPGNLTTWLTAGTSHHITFVLHQVANLGRAA